MLVGFGVMVLAGTAPIQIVLASNAKPPQWIGLVSATSTAIAALGALAAAYFSMQQARQVGRARQAEHLIPSFDSLRRNTLAVRQASVTFQVALRELVGHQSFRQVATETATKMTDAVAEVEHVGLKLATGPRHAIVSARALQLAAETALLAMTVQFREITAEEAEAVVQEFKSLDGTVEKLLGAVAKAETELLAD